MYHKTLEKNSGAYISQKSFCGLKGGRALSFGGGGEG